MKQIDYYKLKNITAIHICDISTEYGYLYRETYKDKYWWFSKPTYRNDGLIRNEGYDEDYCVWHSKESIKKETKVNNQKLFLIIDNVVYNRARSTVMFSDKSSYVQLFDTIDEAIEWSENLLRTANIETEIMRIN